jgi:hypothetical protein
VGDCGKPIVARESFSSWDQVAQWDPSAADAHQLKEAGRKRDEICRRDLPITVGRKPRRFSSLRPSVTLPHAPGLSRSLPADKYCIGVRLDWVIHIHEYWRPTGVAGGLRMSPPCFSVGCKVA